MTPDEFKWRQVKDAKGSYAHRPEAHTYPGPDGWDHCEWCRVEHYCELMHDAYERGAIIHGWETNPASRHQDWADVPEANKATMRLAVAALLAAVDGENGGQH